MASPELHSELGPSASHRWLNCPPSVLACRNEIDPPSEFAAEGTVAHSLAEYMLTCYFRAPQGPTPKEILESKYYSRDMWGYVEGYTNWVIEEYNVMAAEDKHTFIDLESSVVYDDWVPGGFGTSDVVIYNSKTLHVIDLKYGQGVPVDAHDNPQLKLYALGVWQTMGILFDTIETVRMSINQPRLHAESTFEMPLKDLIEWADTYVRPRAMLASKGEGDYKSGEHCRWCLIKAKCRERYEANMEMAKYDFANPNTLTNDELGAVLEQVKHMAVWAKDVETYVFEQAKKGETFPGWKLVAGRSNRYITDKEKAQTILENHGYKSDKIMTDPKPELLSLTALETSVGKKEFNDLLGPLIDKSEGKPTLVDESDKREAINSVQSAVDDFS